MAFATGLLGFDASRVVEVSRYQGGLQRHTERASTVFESLAGGRRVRLAPQGPRAWEVSGDFGQGEELSILETLYLDSAGARVVWFDPAAMASNMLTPQQASFRPGWVDGGVGRVSVPIVGGLRAPSVQTPAPGAWVKVTTAPAAVGLSGAVPVRPGQKVTAGVYGIGLVDIRIRFNGSDGEQVGEVSTSGMTLSSESDRVTLTETAPEAARTADLFVRGDGLAAPSLTLTSSPQPWTPGHGCLSAVLTDFSETPKLVDLHTPERTYSTFTAKIQEVI